MAPASKPPNRRSRKPAAPASQASQLAMQEWSLDRLHGYARNPRKNDAVVERMAEAIREFGFRIPIVARSTGEVVDGHLRLKAAHFLKLKTVPVVLADELTEEQVRAFRMLANRSANWAEWDFGLVALEMKDLLAGDYDLGMTGFEPQEIDKVFKEHGGLLDGPGVADEDDAPPLPEQPVSRPGDLWHLGRHRLLCGDALRLDDVEHVLDGAPAAMCFTDPPYNVDYGRSMKKDRLRGNKRRIINDNLGSGFEAFLTEVSVNLLRLTRGAIYICMSSSELDTLQRSFVGAGGKWSTFIIWVKQHHTMGRSDYHRQYEPILYGWKVGSEHYWSGSRAQGDVWHFDRPTRADLHPTMKPVALVERAIRNSSKTRDTVLDPFGGSGSTLIAAEKAGRQARLVEIDPGYCDVIVRRWETFTGRAAMLEGDEDRTFEAMSAAPSRPQAAPLSVSAARP